MTASVFASQRQDLYRRFSVELTFRDKVYGGIPRDPKLIEGWLRAKAGITQEDEIRRMLLTTLQELGAEIGPDATDEQIMAASEALAAVKSTNGFKQDGDGLYIEDRQIKAMLKEAISVVYPWPYWKITKDGRGHGGDRGPDGVLLEAKARGGKTPYKLLAETVFIEPGHVHLGRSAADGVDLSVVHTEHMGQPQSALSYVEYVHGAVISFELLAVRNSIPDDWWPSIWMHAEQGGLGASRSQSQGRFDVTRWDEQGVS